MHRHVPTLTVAQEAFPSAIDNERFSLENAVRLYANSVTPRAVGVVVRTYPSNAAYEIEVLEPDGTTVAVNTVPAEELILK